jgi:hypothetical protein
MNSLIRNKKVCELLNEVDNLLIDRLGRHANTQMMTAGSVIGYEIRYLVIIYFKRMSILINSKSHHRLQSSNDKYTLKDA